jgi:hypothetical protein
VPCDACDARSTVSRFIRPERRGSSLGSSLSVELLVKLCLELSLSLSLSSWYFRQLAQRRQLCFRRKLCLALAVAELGISHYLGCPEVVLVMLVLCSSTLSTLKIKWYHVTPQTAPDISIPHPVPSSFIPTQKVHASSHFCSPTCPWACPPDPA